MVLGLDVKTKEVKLKPLDFENIKIMKDHYFPDAYTIDLPLNSKPDHVWQYIFEREWKSSRQLWDRKLFLVGDKLRLVTSTNNIKEKLDWIKEIIKHTNEDVKEYNRNVKINKAKLSEQALEEERVTVERIRKRLRRIRTF